MAPSKVHQLLHGYSRGHTLLSGSIDLPPDIQRQLTILSDLSGATSTDGFDTYLTGYPLSKVGYFAVARTWTAPEMPRPGCVWTHTILLDFQTLGGLASFEQIEPLFCRPAGGTDGKFDAYSKPIEISTRHHPSTFIGTSSDMVVVGRLLEGLYEGPKRPVILLAESSRIFEQLVTSIWLQQWPDLRKSFLFCSGAIAPRLQNNTPFDLQVCPQNAARNIRRAQSNAIIIDSAAKSTETANWALALSRELVGNSNSSFREYLASAGKGLSDRTLAGTLIDLYASNRDDHHTGSLVGTFLKPNRYLALKSFLEKPDTLENCGLSQDTPYLVLEMISRIEGPTHDYSPNVAIEIASTLTKRDADRGLKLAVNLCSGSLNEFGQSLLAALIELAPTEKIIQLLPEQRQLVYGLIHLKPSLIGLPELWQQMNANQTDLANIFIRTDPGSAMIESAILAILHTNSTKALNRLAAQWPRIAVKSLLNYLSRAQANQSWKPSLTRIVGRHPEAAIDWLEHNEAPVSFAASILTMLDPSDNRVRTADFSTWTKLSELAANSPNDTASINIGAFLTAVALSTRDPKRVYVLIPHFFRLHSALEKDRLDGDIWDSLSQQLPDLEWWHSWDKCERLRRGVLKELAGEEPELLLDLFKKAPNEKTLSHLIDSLMIQKNGKNLLKKLASSGVFDRSSSQLQHSIERFVR